MAYSDREYKDASQIAYLGFFNKVEKSLGKENGPYTIEQLVTKYIDLPYAEETAKMLNPGREKFTLKELVKYSEISDGEKEILLSISDEAYNWKVVETRNGRLGNNYNTGFYGCVLETSENDAIVAFRGSEGAIKYENLEDDWLEADAALLLGKLTEQEAVAEQFARELQESGVLEKYNSISATGHSLGGELATHFTVHCAEKEPELFNKIDECVNMDGPGHSKKYIENHKDGIAKASNKITHYRWSIVGNILKPLPGEKVIDLDVEDKSGEYNFSENLAYELAGRHSLSSLVFEENNMAKRGKGNAISGISYILTNFIDDAGLGICTFSFAEFIVKDCIQKDKDGNIKLTEYGKQLISDILSDSLVEPFIVGAIIFVIALKCMDLWDKYGDKIILLITTELKKVLNDVSNLIDDIAYEFINFWSYIKEQFKKDFYLGYSYATDNPCIKVNTDLLKEYASRLSYLNNKIINIDKNMKSLYLNVGLIDLFNLVQADILVNYNLKIERCKNYLNNTADNFIEAERNIMRAF